MKRARLSLVFALMVALWFPPILSRADALDLAVVAAQSEEEEIIRSVYARYAELNAAAPQQATFELDDFRTVPWSRFDQIRYLDVATLPSGDLLQLERVTRNADYGDARYVVYELSWQPAGHDYLSSAEGRQVAVLSLDEFLRMVEDPQAAVADALTQYRATVQLDGQSRTYDAAFLWFREAGEISAFKVLDHVTGGVDFAAGEELPTRSEMQRMLAESPGRVTSLSLDRVTAASHACYSSGINRDLERSVAGWGGHSSGEHRGKATFDVYCSCDVACTSICDATIRNGTGLCSDWGTTSDGCHKMVVGRDEFASFEGDGNLTGASCYAGYGCAQRACLGCLCGLSVSVSANKSGVSFSYSSTPHWTAQLQFGGTCQLCAEELHSGAGCDDGSEDDPWAPQLTAVGSGLGRVTAALCQDPDSTPVVIDVAGDGFRFTSVEEGVYFDFDGVGAVERMAWTEAGSDDAFLVADLNRNGRIDNGRELFGNLTPQPQDLGGVHGYNALQQYDHGAGGDGDGMITRRDSYFAELMLWRDANHNGVSEPEELTWLAGTAIEGIDLRYVESRRRDRHGNELRYTSKVPLLHGDEEIAGKPGRRHVMATDVILRSGH